MTTYNTYADAANTAVRAFLTSVGEHYLGETFNTGSGSGKRIWETIKEEFDHRCAYCNKQTTLQIEHLVMFNRTEYGLHHPGNIVPTCQDCNKRQRKKVEISPERVKKVYVNWEGQLKAICKGNETNFNKRKKKIEKSIKKYNYPELSKNEENSIRVMAESLYGLIKQSGDNTNILYKELEKSFVVEKK
ncbi:HNH endonuclease [Candidatus Nitrosopelagicus sp.]|nr:HNH endonuclease [Candidatus Nitrosopelagicus sp.]